MVVMVMVVIVTVCVCCVQAKLVANGDVEELEPQDDMGRTDWRRQHIFRKVCMLHTPEGEGGRGSSLMYARTYTRT